MRAPAQTGKFEVQIECGKLVWPKLESNRMPTTKKHMEFIYKCIEEALI